MNKEDAYKIALNQVKTGEMSEGIWAKAVAYSEGDEGKAKANYLKFRSRQLRSPLRHFSGKGKADWVAKDDGPISIKAVVISFLLIVMFIVFIGACSGFR